MNWLSGLFQGASNLIGNYWQYILGMDNLNYQKGKDQHLTGAQQEANAFSAAEAQKARDWQEMMYTQYQSPQALMRQAQEAGINPAALYGQAFSGHTPAASTGPFSVTPQGGDTNGAIAQLVGLAKSVAEIDLIKSQTKETDSRVVLNESQVKKIGSEIGKIGADTELVRKTMEKLGIEMDVLEVEKSLKAAQKSFYNANARGLNAQAWLDEWRSGFILQNDETPEMHNQRVNTWINAGAQVLSSLISGGLDIVGDFVAKPIETITEKHSTMTQIGGKARKAITTSLDEIIKSTTKKTLTL